MKSKDLKLNIVFPEDDSNQESLTELIRNIKFSIKKVLGEKYTCDIASMSQVDDDESPFSKNTFYILILGSDSNDKEAYQNQLKYICDNLLFEKCIEVPPRVMKLLLKPNNQVEQPESLKPYIGHQFFSYSTRGSVLKSRNHRSNEFDIWGMVLDVAYEFMQLVESSLEEPDKLKYAYLVGKSELQASFYNDVKREFQQYGFNILPYIDFPEDAAERKEFINECLDTSEFIVHVVGPQYGQIRKGDRVSILENENSLIQEYLANKSGIFRLIWIPSEYRINDARQGRFINHLKKTGVSINSKIINGSLQECKDEISRLVKLSLESEKNTRALKRTVYLMAQEEELKPELEESIKALGCTLVNEGSIENSTNAYLSHLDNLKKSDNLIIYYKNEKWLYSRLGDIIKIKGIGKRDPWNVVLIFGNTPIDLSEHKKWLPDLKIIDSGSFNDLEEQLKVLL